MPPETDDDAHDETDPPPAQESESLDARIRRVVLDLLGEADDDPDGGDDAGGSDAGGASAPAPRGDESRMESLVRDAVAKLRREEKVDARLEDVEKTVRTIREEKPQEVRRVTRAMWG